MARDHTMENDQQFAFEVEFNRLARLAGGEGGQDSLARAAALARISNALETGPLLSLALRIKVQATEPEPPPGL